MTLEVLIACMHQKDRSIVDRTNVTGDVLIINQTNKVSSSEFSHRPGKTTRIISTKERGLSKSRNMAIKNATNDICLLVDDDEILETDYEEKILNAYIENPDADIIAFALEYPGKKYSKRKYNVGYLSALQIGSCQITFKRKAILEHQILFNESFGSGTGNGPGEENLFLFDCLKKKLKIVYCPLIIGAVKQEESQWFTGFNVQYFINRGKVTKVLLGSFWAMLYAVYFAFRKHSIYRQETGFVQALLYMIKGIQSAPQK